MRRGPAAAQYVLHDSAAGTAQPHRPGTMTRTPRRTRRLSLSAVALCHLTGGCMTATWIGYRATRPDVARARATTGMSGV